MRLARLAMVVGLAALAVACSDPRDGGSGDGGGGGSAVSGPAVSGPEGWTRLAPTDLERMLEEEDVYLVNVHVPDEGDIRGTDASIPYTDVASRVDELPTDGDPVLVLYCRSGNMSTQAAQDLVDAGVSGFYELEGGFIAWTEAGLPFEAP
jgi:rhodanese-related sulfurtransferase